MIRSGLEAAILNFPLPVLLYNTQLDTHVIDTWGFCVNLVLAATSVLLRNITVLAT